MARAGLMKNVRQIHKVKTTPGVVLKLWKKMDVSQATKRNNKTKKNILSKHNSQYSNLYTIFFSHSNSICKRCFPLTLWAQTHGTQNQLLNLMKITVLIYNVHKMSNLLLKVLLFLKIRHQVCLADQQQLNQARQQWKERKR